jgi:dethiobiotin synthetase
VSEYADRIRVLADFHETVLVEGAGGLLVRLDTEGGTLLDLAASLADTAAAGVTVEVVVVARAGLGTLNHSELTVQVLRARGIEPTGLVIGAWPAEPGLAENCNRADLPRVTGVPVIGVIPEGAGALDRAAFEAAAPSWAH